MFEVHGKVILTEKTKPDVIKLKKELNEGTRILKCKDYKTSTGLDIMAKKDVKAAHYMANIAIQVNGEKGTKNMSFSLVKLYL
ncbi:hypothetical protein MP638_005287 [Amoeboaphelidium occidentale]|nr:hypothetical protein MP638_005287 [Amoeboaphelidium occidentale]